MRASNHPITAVVSASELFSRFITLAKFDDKTAHECKEIMVHRGELFLKKLLEARNLIAKQGSQFVTEGCVSNIVQFSNAMLNFVEQCHVLYVYLYFHFL